MGPEFIDKVFSAPEVVTLKCAYPSEFNDPYELFLTMDFKEKPELIAFYADVVGELPQLPTTCFSRSPAVVPMWAHYSNNLQGFALEIDQATLEVKFPKSGFGDVDYRDEPSDAVAGNLFRAYEIGKFRYMHFLRKSVFISAYYTKQLCWAYEMECRMIAAESEVSKRDGLMLLDVPISCVHSIVCGPRVTAATVEHLRIKAESIGCRFIKMQIGRSSSTPFFITSDGNPAVFDGTGISPVRYSCMNCKEPILEKTERCSWCQIDDSHRQNAANRNSYRTLAQYGMLESYIENVNRIDRGEG